MTKLTIGRMAKLYQLHRSTLYEAIAKGRVSCGFDGKGQRVIDLSEMIRVYGEAPASGSHHPTHPTASQTPPDSSELLARFDELLRLTERQSNQLEGLRKEVAELKQQLALPPPSAFSRHEEAPPASDKRRGKVATFADLMARLEARSHS